VARSQLRSPALSSAWGARHVEHTGTTYGGETVGGSSCGVERSPGGRSTKMISDSCPYANRKVLIKRVGETLLPAVPVDWMNGPSPRAKPVSPPTSGPEAAW
jgi:hypothetical protein